MDIHLHVIRGEEVIKENIFTGRSAAWFDNLRKRGCQEEYDALPTSYGIPEVAPALIKAAWAYKSDQNYFDFQYLLVREFLSWFRKYRPDRDAGWVTTYDKWRIENKGYIPEDPIRYLSKEVLEENGQDLNFVTFENPYDCSKWLYDYLMSYTEIEYNDIIVFYFDN